MARKPSVDKSVLEAALEGLELQKARIEDQIRNVRRLLGGKVASAPAVAIPAATTGSATPAPRKKRELSAAARERIAAAQKRRWAAFHKKTGPKAASPKSKEKKEA